MSIVNCVFCENQYDTDLEDCCPSCNARNEVCSNCSELINKEDLVLDVNEWNVDGVQMKETYVSGYICPECGHVEDFE